jgi:hypothetical protein
LPGIVFRSKSKKKAARKVFIVRANRFSAFQMKSTGTIITPRSMRSRRVKLSLRLDIYLNSGTRYKVQGTRLMRRDERDERASETGEEEGNQRTDDSCI